MSAKNASSWVFRSTPLREGRLQEAMRCKAMGMFRSTPLREGRHIPTCKISDIMEFRSTPLREGRLDRRHLGVVR